MRKTHLNYLLDLVIGLAFTGAAVTGIAFLLMGSSGYQGGRNPQFATALLGVSRTMWSDLHTWTSLVMMAGVGIHLALHAKWIACVTGQIFSAPWLRALPRLRRREETCEVTA